MITAATNEKSVTRNISHFRQIQYAEKTPEGDDSDSSDDIGESNTDQATPVTPPPQQPQPPSHSSRRSPLRQKKPCQKYRQNVYDY